MTGTGDLISYTGADALSTREAIVTARAELERRKLALAKQQEQQREELDRRRRELEAEFAKARQELAEQMKPLSEQLAKMVEVMWTVDLYLGRDESLELIRDGAPAPADTPITVRQKVLVMAEESLILMGEGGTGMTADNLPEFVDWLRQSDENLDRILPEQKGVVVLIPTRVKSRTGNAWEDAGRDASNSVSYWLLRNGQKLYLLTVDEDLIIRDRVLPRRREFVEVFDHALFGVSGKPVEPGSDRWFELEEVADARRRHYMRILMVLQGLIDRTPVWHPLPPSGVSFLSMKDRDAGKVELIEDDESSIQLGEGGESFRDWQRRLNGMLRPGLRVIGDWHSEGFRDLYERSEYRRGHHPRLFPGTVESRPEANVPHLLEGRKDGGFVIRFTRTDHVYRRNVPIPDRPGWVYSGEVATEAKTRASCVVKPDDDWVLPFDLVTVPELEKFLASREERSKHFLSMVPTVRAALEAKRAEAAEEHDFRDLLGRLLIMEGADADGIADLVENLVHWWKLAHTWAKPLDAGGARSKRAAGQILAEYRSRVRAAAEDSDAIIAAGRAVDGVIAVARDRQGRWFAYAPTPGTHDAGVFLDITRIYRDGRLGETKTSQIVATRSVAALHVAWSDDVWAGWQFGANPRHYLTEPQRRDLVAEAVRRAAGPVLCVVELWDPQHPEGRWLGVYSWTLPNVPRPAQAPVEQSRDPLSWHRDGPAAVTMQAWRVVRGDDGPHLAAKESGQHGISSWFSRFTVKSRWGSIPWWPDDATRYAEVRPRLVWADEPLLDELAAWRDRCRAEADAAQATKAAREAEARRYSQAIDAAIHQRQLAAVRERFEADYGADADDLWDAHLKSLDLQVPFSPHITSQVVYTAICDGRPIVGETIQSLADAAVESPHNTADRWGRRHIKRVDFGEYGEILAPEPPADDTREM